MPRHSSMYLYARQEFILT